MTFIVCASYTTEINIIMYKFVVNYTTVEVDLLLRLM